MLYLTCITITSVDLAHYGGSRAKNWVSVYCSTNFLVIPIYPYFRQGSYILAADETVENLVQCLKKQRNES